MSERDLTTNNRYANVLLGLKKTDPLSLTKAINEGLPYSAVDVFSKQMLLQPTQVGRAIRVTGPKLIRRERDGRMLPEESDRLVRLSRVFALAIDLFDGDRVAAKGWLQSPQRALGSETPLAFASNEVGAREVERLIGRLEHGVVA